MTGDGHVRLVDDKPTNAVINRRRRTKVHFTGGARPFIVSRVGDRLVVTCSEQFYIIPQTESGIILEPVE